MRRSRLLLACLLLTAPTAAALEGSGDANGDGSVDILDITRVVACALGCPGGPAPGMDLDGSGGIDVLDVQAVIQVVLGPRPSILEVLPRQAGPGELLRIDGRNLVVGHLELAGLAFPAVVQRPTVIVARLPVGADPSHRCVHLPMIEPRINIYVNGAGAP